MNHTGKSVQRSGLQASRALRRLSSQDHRQSNRPREAHTNGRATPLTGSSMKTLERPLRSAMREDAFSLNRQPRSEPAQRIDVKIARLSLGERVPATTLAECYAWRFEQGHLASVDRQQFANPATNRAVSSSHFNEQ